MLQTETLIILDWDDTIFPTSWIFKNKIDIFKQDVRESYMLHFTELDNIASRVIKKFLTFGQVVIVSNALPAWLHFSGLLLPKTYNLLLKQSEFISARADFQTVSTDINKWKELAFKKIFIKKLFTKQIQNIISVGDADYEYHALIKLYNYNKLRSNKRYLKSIKFIKDPTFDTLIDELQVLYKSIPQICMIKKQLDLNFKNI